MLTVLIGTLLVPVGCSSDDDNETTNTEDFLDNLSESEILSMKQGDAVRTVLATLCGVQELEVDFDQQTYEPIYGNVRDESSPYTRSFRVETEEDAEGYFKTLIGQDDLIEETADGYKVNLKDMHLLSNGTLSSLGTLTYHRGGENGILGYVDVDIQCIPHLKRIEYVPSSVWGSNGIVSTDGYTAGSVVYIKNSSYATGYYLCVRGHENGDCKGGLLVKICWGSGRMKYKNNNTKEYDTVNLDDDGDGAWYPHNKPTPTDIKQYLQWISKNPEKCRKIRKFFSGGIQGLRPKENSNGVSDVLPDNFGVDSNGQYWTVRNTCYIFYDSRYGKYAWIPAYDYRHASYMCVQEMKEFNEWKTSTSEKKYVKDTDWNKFYKGIRPYTINVIHFDTRLNDAHEYAL